MSRVFAISDIHGCSKTFKKLVLEEIKLELSDILYCLGDYVNRGNDSKGVIDFILDLRKNGYTVHTLRGNHEQLMLDLYLQANTSEQWIKSGGLLTFKSFNISSIHDLPETYLSFLEDTKHFIETDAFVFVHAGLNFELDDPFTDYKAMLWTRDSYFVKEKIKNKTLIHGHTPASLKSILKPSNPYNINIDGGCVKTHKLDLGNLVALSLPDMNFISIRNID